MEEEKINDDYLKHIAVQFVSKAFEEWEESEEN